MFTTLLRSVGGALTQLCRGVQTASSSATLRNLSSFSAPSFSRLVPNIRRLGGIIALFAAAPSKGCGGEDSAAQPISPTGRRAANLTINDAGDVGYDLEKKEGGDREICIVPYDSVEPNCFDQGGDSFVPSINNARGVLYLFGSPNSAAVRYRPADGEDKLIADRGGCFFTASSLLEGVFAYVCNDPEEGQSLYTNDLNGNETRISREGHAVECASLSRNGGRLAYVTAGAVHPDDKNGTWDVYLRDVPQGTDEWVSRNRLGQQRNVPSDNPSLFEQGATILLSYVTVFLPEEQEDPDNPQWNQMIVISEVVYDPLANTWASTVLEEIETDRPASAGRRVDIKPYLGGEGGRYLLHLRADGLYLMDRRNPKRPILIDPDATEGVMNAQGDIAYVDSSGRVFRTHVSNFF